MKLFKKVLAGVAVAAALASPAHAALTTVLGVTWDPESTTPLDFQASSNFSQWYQTAANGFAFNPTGAVTTFTTPASIVGSFITGGGKMNTINGVNNIPGDPIPETTPPIYAPGAEMTYTYGGIEILSVVGTVFTFDLSNSFFNVFVDTPPNYSESTGTLIEQLDAADGLLFLSGHFDTFGLLANVLTANGTLVGFADGLISVTAGAAVNNFNTDTLINPDGVSPNSDLTFSGSSQIAVGSVISSVGTGEFQGDSISIPEPGTLALLGIAMLAASTVSRRRRTMR
jgi:hypothetical protein